MTCVNVLIWRCRAHHQSNTSKTEPAIWCMHWSHVKTVGRLKLLNTLYSFANERTVVASLFFYNNLNVIRILGDNFLFHFFQLIFFSSNSCAVCVAVFSSVNSVWYEHVFVCVEVILLLLLSAMWVHGASRDRGFTCLSVNCECWPSLQFIRGYIVHTHTHTHCGASAQSGFWIELNHLVVYCVHSSL